MATEEIIRALTTENEQLRSRVKELEAKLPGRKGYLFIAGGDVDGSPTASAERYDPNLAFWTPVRRMHEARSGHVLVRHRNYLYAIGGKATDPIIHGQITCLNSVERYDVTADRWERVAPMIKERYDCAAVVLDDEIYVFGGKVLFEYNHVTKTRATPRVEKYNPQTNTWSELPKMNHARSNLSVIVVNKTQYVIGGDNFDGSKVLDTIERLDAKNQKWIEEGYCVTHEHASHPATVIAHNGRIVTLGGQFTKTPDTWRSLTDVIPTVSRKTVTSWTPFDNSVVLLDDSRCHVYDSQSSTWSPLARTCRKRKFARIASVPIGQADEDHVTTAARKGTGLAPNPNIPYYGNATIQCLYTIDQLRDYFLANRFEDDAVPLCRPLAKVFRALFEGSDQTPTDIRKYEGNGSAVKRINTNQSQSFLKEYLRRAERELEEYYKRRGLSNLSPFKRLFGGEIQNHVVCAHCGMATAEKETFLPYIVKIDADIEPFLATYFKEQSTARRLECRSVLCDGTKQEATRRRIMTRCPRVLIVLVTNTQHVAVTLPPSIAFQYEYSLFAVAVKQPDPHRLVSYCQRENDEWLLFDDSTVTPVARPTETSSNTWLFYRQNQ